MIFILVLGSSNGACLPTVWPRFKFCALGCNWVEFVVGFHPCSEGFSKGSPVFLPPNSVNSNLIWKQWKKSLSEGCATANSHLVNINYNIIIYYTL